MPFWHMLYFLFPLPLKPWRLFRIPSLRQMASLDSKSLALLECSSLSALALASSPLRWVSETTSHLQGAGGDRNHLVAALGQANSLLLCNTFKTTTAKVEINSVRPRPRFIIDIWLSPHWATCILWFGSWTGKVLWGIRVWSQTLQPGTKGDQLLSFLPDSGENLRHGLVVPMWCGNYQCLG